MDIIGNFRMNGSMKKTGLSLGLLGAILLFFWQVWVTLDARIDTNTVKISRNEVKSYSIDKTLDEIRIMQKEIRDDIKIILRGK